MGNPVSSAVPRRSKMRPCPSAVAVWPWMGDGALYGSSFGLALALLRSSDST
jgi:hypothetical protein